MHSKIGGRLYDSVPLPQHHTTHLTIPQKLVLVRNSPVRRLLEKVLTCVVVVQSATGPHVHPGVGEQIVRAQLHEVVVTNLAQVGRMSVSRA